MTQSFQPDSGLIIVPTEISGPSGTAVIRLALDTGATATLINTGLLVALGHDTAASANRIEITTGSGIEYASRINLDSFTALEKKQNHFPVLAHTLPPSAGVDGLLGLDFFRGQILSIDFLNGQISLKNEDSK